MAGDQNRRNQERRLNTPEEQGSEYVLLESIDHLEDLTRGMRKYFFFIGSTKISVDRAGGYVSGRLSIHGNYFHSRV